MREQRLGAGRSVHAKAGTDETQTFYNHLHASLKSTVIFVLRVLCLPSLRVSATLHLCSSNTGNTRSSANTPSSLLCRAAFTPAVKLKHSAWWRVCPQAFPERSQTDSNKTPNPTFQIGFSINQTSIFFRPKSWRKLPCLWKVPIPTIYKSITCCVTKILDKNII